MLPNSPGLVGCQLGGSGCPQKFVLFALLSPLTIPASFQQRGGKPWLACPRVSVWVKAGPSRQQPAMEQTQSHWPGPQPTSHGGSGANLSPFPPKEMALSPLSLITQSLSDWNHRESP